MMWELKRREPTTTLLFLAKKVLCMCFCWVREMRFTKLPRAPYHTTQPLLLRSLSLRIVTAILESILYTKVPVSLYLARFAISWQTHLISLLLLPKLEELVFQFFLHLRVDHNLSSSLPCPDHCRTRK